MDDRIKKMEELSDALIKSLNQRYKAEQKIKEDVATLISRINTGLRAKETFNEKYQYLVKTLKEAILAKTEVEANIAQSTNKPSYEGKMTSITEAISYLKIQIEHYESVLTLEEKTASKKAEIPDSSVKKIKWNGTPALFGFVFLELAKKGYIDFPLHNGEINPTRLAKTLYEMFELNTSQEYFIKQMNPSSNALSTTKRNKFTIPELKDLD